MKRGSRKTMMSFQLLLVLASFQSTWFRVCNGVPIEDHELQIRNADNCLILDFNETFVKNTCGHLQIFVQDSGDLVFASPYPFGENETNNSRRCGNQTVYVGKNKEEDRQRVSIPVCGFSSKYCNHQCWLQSVCVRKNVVEDHVQREINATEYMCTALEDNKKTVVIEDSTRPPAETYGQPNCDDCQKLLTCDSLVYKVLLGVIAIAFVALVLCFVLLPRQFIKLSKRISRRKFGRCVRPSAEEVVE